MEIINDKLVGEGVAYAPTSKIGNGVNKRKFIVVHYTAGGNYANDVKTLSSSPKQVSCHLVIGRDKEQVTQIGDFNDIQWHAGASQWKGINGLNSYSIGIELTNPGWMELSADKKTATTYYGKVYEVETSKLIIARHPALGNKEYGWLPYTQIQLQNLMDVVEALKAAYPTIEEVVGHEQISPGRKQDPGIGIILSQKLMDKLNETNMDGSDHFYEGTDDLVHLNRDYKDPSESAGLYQVKTAGTALRIRDNYSSTANVIGSLNNGDLVRVERINGGFAKLAARKTGPSINPDDGYKTLDGYASVVYLKKVD
ncbi:putative N-acetylmuramoyl-L-alanine amidase [Rhizobium phage P9VFCI]|uniref:N-acetylmuramoyl-L-alanine amidase n=1 Tax=Rhizobium phage P9VFCI TaxID=2763531 RepID=A0A7G7WX73_9CAUD|nr:endolysin [Rhizobium phage P9VFCI]QNH71817.1 putative N-acetylmuramoyl-L-alanine amidase [Rhizobium phage P9VFCI]